MSPKDTCNLSMQSKGTSTFLISLSQGLNLKVAKFSVFNPLLKLYCPLKTFWSNKKRADNTGHVYYIIETPFGKLAIYG